MSVGTGKLSPFKKHGTGSTTISSSKSKHGATREGFYDNVDITEASRNVTKLEPFKTGPTGPGRNTNPDHPDFKEGGPKIKTFPAFSNRRCEY
jgi:hypothetical protein